MKKFFALFFVVFLTACSDPTPPELEVSLKSIHQGAGIYSTFLFITSLEDSVTIEGVEVNRGNCKKEDNNTFPLTMKYGDTARFYFNLAGNTTYTGVCQYKEAAVTTKEGSFVFTF